MSDATLGDALLRVILDRSVIADTVEDGLDVLTQRLGRDLSRTMIAAVVHDVVTSGLAYDPVRLPAGALQCHWHLELTPRGQQATLRARPFTSETD